MMPDTIKSRRGSYIVEATILYPLIVVVTVMIFVIFIFFFMNTHEIYRSAHVVRGLSAKNEYIVSYGMDWDHSYRTYDYKVAGYDRKTYVAERENEVKNTLTFSFNGKESYTISRHEFNEAQKIWLTRNTSV